MVLLGQAHMVKRISIHFRHIPIKPRLHHFYQYFFHFLRKYFVRIRDEKNEESKEDTPAVKSAPKASRSLWNDGDQEFMRILGRYIVIQKVSKVR